MIKVSVIMPVYNSEEYIEMAAESVLKQDLEEIELIMVDDGSTDNSGEICDKIADKDKRVVVIHRQNGGISAARNTGILKAKGEYLAFIDNDDIYIEGFLRNIYEYAVENNADVIKYGYRVIEDWHKSEECARIRGFSDNKMVDFESIEKTYKELKRDGFFNMIWNGLYKRDLIISNRLLFPENVKRGYEDWIYNFRLLQIENIKNIYLWKGIEYNHYQRGSHSVSGSYYSNQQNALIMAAKEEYRLINYLNQKYGGNINWIPYSMDYFLEAILMFERKNCSLTKTEKARYLKKLSQMEEFRNLSNKSNAKYFNVTKKAVCSLLRKEKFYLLLTVSHIYNYYVVYKRKKYM